jgi:hypothetical protein
MGFAHRAFVAAGVGFAAAAIVGCGSSGGSLLSASQSNNLLEQLNRVTQALDESNCAQARQYLADFQTTVDNLGGVNSTLVSNLDQGASTIQSLADRDCQTSVKTVTTPKKTHPKTTTQTTPTQTTSTFTVPTTTTTYTAPAYTTTTYSTPSTTTTGGSCLTCGTTTTTTSTVSSTTTPTGGTGLGGNTDTSTTSDTTTTTSTTSTTGTTDTSGGGF